MLALELEQSRRGGNDVSRLPKRTTVASGRLNAREQGGNIKLKISQWECRSQQVNNEDNVVEAHPPVVSRTYSGDILGTGFHNKSLSGRNPSKVDLSKAKSLGLDFRESKSQTGPLPRHSAPLQNSSGNCSENKPQVASISAFIKVDANIEKSSSKDVVKFNCSHKSGCPLDTEAVSQPQFEAADLPAGNFYTSRGFWRKLEGNKLHWEKGTVVGHQPPAKPQRTFQYQGLSNANRFHKHFSHNNQLLSVKSGRLVQPPNFPPPPCPDAKTNGISRRKKSRKSFEYEDAARLTTKQSVLGGEGRHSGLYHAFSDDNIYEDIVCEGTIDNPYEEVKQSPMCLPIGRPPVPKFPSKPLAFQGHIGKMEKGNKGNFATSKSLNLADAPKSVATHRASTQKSLKPPQYVNKIETIFDEKRGKKRVKNHGIPVREEASGTESDQEDNTKGGSRRSVYIQSTLKHRPGYRTLEKDLIQLQEQQLFQIFVVVSLRKGTPGAAYSPEITQQFPKMFENSSRLSKEAEDHLKIIPKFCFPDAQDWKPCADTPSETFSFVLTGEDGSRWFCYCRKILPGGKGKMLPEVHCVVSKLGCFDLFAKILEEVERRREISPALVYPFMRSVMEAPFPAPGRTVTIKSFLPGSGNEELTLCRPVDSRLEHVDFDSMLKCLSTGKLLQVFASLLLERRVIFIADKLSVLSRCSHAVLALLYPFTWQHTFIPVLPASMLDISCSPTPFLIGVLAPCLPELLELPIEEVLIVDLCADKFVIQLGDEDCILPSKLHAALQQILEEREDMLRQDDEEQSSGQQAELSALLSEAFVRFFVELVGHYPLHMAESSSGHKEIQRESFRKSHPSRGVRQFLQLFMQTQMFAGFIQDKELCKSGGHGLFEVRVNEFLGSNPEPGPSSVNKFLKGLGNKMKLLQIK